MRCLDIDGIFRVGWLASVTSFLLTICIDREEQLALITPVDDSAISLFRGGRRIGSLLMITFRRDWIAPGERRARTSHHPGLFEKPAFRSP